MLNFSRMTIHNQVQKIKETGSKDRRKGSGRPIAEKRAFDKESAWLKIEFGLTFICC